MGTELVKTYGSAVAIRKALPSLVDQYDYNEKVAAMRKYVKDKETLRKFAIEDLESQVALAMTLPEALKRGDVKVNNNKQYEVSTVDTAIPSATVGRWRQVKDVPVSMRKEFYEDTSVPTRNGLLRWYEQQCDEAVIDVEEEQDAGDLPPGPFTIIYADPPWRYDYSPTNSRKIENQYETASLEEICDLDIESIAAKNCLLYLWSTNPKLSEAFQVIEAWGFEYRTNMVWVKDRSGMGYYARQRHELLLICAIGNPVPPADRKRPDSVIEAPRGEHSAKPECVYEMIESLYGKTRKIELFSRKQRAGWKNWGFEAGS